MLAPSGIYFCVRNEVRILPFLPPTWLASRPSTTFFFYDLTFSHCFKISLFITCQTPHTCRVLKKNPLLRTSLVVQWLSLHASNAGSIPSQGTSSHMPQQRPSAFKFLKFSSCWGVFIFQDNIDTECIEISGRVISPSILLFVHLFSQMNLIVWGVNLYRLI